jgi:hypothetical protein
VIGTALAEETGFDSLASTEEKRWQRIVRVPPETLMMTEAGTAEPRWLARQSVAEPVDCKLALGARFLALQWVSDATSWEKRHGRHLLIGSHFTNMGDAASRTVCHEESVPLANTIDQPIRVVDVSRPVEAAFRAAQYETFGDGEESEFAKALVLLVRQYGSSAVDAIRKLITFDHLDEVASVALRTLGRVQHPMSRASRLRLLEHALTHHSSWVRDGAALGLASLGDPAAIGPLQRAVAQEPIEELRQDMEAVEQYLETLG